MAQKLYKALKYFDSALVGGKIPNDLFMFGVDAAKPLIEQGLIEEFEEVKPAPSAKKETKPAKRAKSKEVK